MDTQKPKYNKYLFLPVALLAIIIDQITKLLARANLTEMEPVKFIPGFLNLTHTENTGAAFSLFSGQVQILAIVSIIASIIIIYYYLKNISNYTLTTIIAWGLLLGGTGGNLIDRLFLGSVTDFFEFAFIDFPVFNFADIFIDTGAFLIILFSFLNVKNEKNSARSN
ncbi:MAG: signal peptidase II [Cyanobacteriota bacterium]